MHTCLLVGDSPLANAFYRELSHSLRVIHDKTGLGPWPSVDLVINAADAGPHLVKERAPLKDQTESLRINSLLPARLAFHARALDVPFVHMSSAWVFGTSQSHHPDEEPRPLQGYGTSKWWGELGVRRIYPDASIVRVGWMVGPYRDDWYQPTPHEVLTDHVLGSGAPRYPAYCDVTASFVHVMDVAMVVTAMALSPFTVGKVEHVASADEPATMAEYMVLGGFNVRPVDTKRGMVLGIPLPASFGLVPTLPVLGYDSQWDLLRKGADPSKRRIDQE